MQVRKEQKIRKGKLLGKIIPQLEDKRRLNEEKINELEKSEAKGIYKNHYKFILEKKMEGGLCCPCARWIAEGEKVSQYQITLNEAGQVVKIMSDGKSDGFTVINLSLS